MVGLSKAIESARNIGPSLGGELREVGVATMASLERLGWEEAWLLLCQRNPSCLHLMCGYALLGAIEDIDWLKIPEERKQAAMRFKREIQRDLRNLA